MKLCICALVSFLLFSVNSSIAQTTYLPEGSKEYDLLDRLEIKEQKHSNLLFSAIKPYSRKSVVQHALYLDSMAAANSTNLTPVDRYNLDRLLNNNSEWVNASHDSGKNNYQTFYKNRQHLLEVHEKGFFLAADPVFQIQEGGESLTKKNISLLTYGLTTRGMIANKVGFSFSLAENNEKGPQFFKDRVMQYNSVPGQTDFQSNTNGSYNYLDVRGYLTVNVAKYIDIQAGYDKNFIGNGYRSMFLSDNSGSYPFLKINTKIWKLNYENVFAQQATSNLVAPDKLSRKKYLVYHHLSMNIGRSFNLGIFESESSARANHFDFEYLNPIIFLRQVEGNIGSADKAHVGFDMKANVAKKFQLYGQFLLDEFLLREFIHHNGYWANKWALQAGVKYVDAFNVKNLDLQLEANVVRPFTFSHFDVITNYANGNQALTDPLGANFHELIAILKYQPAPKWHINGRIIYYNQGLDSLGLNLGSNIFLDYRTRARDFGFKIAGGIRASAINAALNIGYELYDNLYLEGTGLFRKYKVDNGIGDNSTSLFTVGIRWNIFRRDYNY